MKKAIRFTRLRPNTEFTQLNIIWYDALHREHFTHEHPADGHDAQRRRKRGQEEQRQHRARRVFAVGEEELDGPDGQVAQRTNGYGQ